MSRSFDSSKSGTTNHEACSFFAALIFVENDQSSAVADKKVQISVTIHIMQSWNAVTANVDLSQVDIAQNPFWFFRGPPIFHQFKSSLTIA